jgi:hypothetical protein
MGLAGRIRVEECFGVEKNFEQTMRVYAEVLRNR